LPYLNQLLHGEAVKHGVHVPSWRQVWMAGGHRGVA